MPLREMNYNDRIELYEKIKDHLTHEINMIEDQFIVSESLEKDIATEIMTSDSELAESKKNILREKMIFEKEEAKRARLEFIYKSKIEIIEDLKQELRSMTVRPEKNKSLSLKKYPAQKLYTGISVDTESFELDELYDLIRRKKKDTKVQLESLKQRLKQVLNK